ncbi:hypothetical protein D3C78_1699590 [compost metagenome]
MPAGFTGGNQVIDAAGPGSQLLIVLEAPQHLGRDIRDQLGTGGRTELIGDHA